MSSVRSRNIRRRPGTEPCRPKPEGFWTALPGWGEQPRTASIATAPKDPGSYLSFRPPGGLPRGLVAGVLRHPGATAPSALPHDRRVPNASSGQIHPVEVAGNNPVYSHGCKCPLPVAAGGGWKLQLHGPWQKTRLRVFQPGVYTSGIHPGHQTGPAPMWGNR